MDFNLWNRKKKVRCSQIWRVGWLGCNGRFVFRHKIAHKERRVSWCIVVVQHPTLVHPQLRPLPVYGFPQTLQNCYVTSAISLIVKRRFWRIKSWTASMWTSSVDVESRPLQGSSSIDVLPVLKRLYHSKYCVWLIHLSLKACWSIFHISVAVFPSLKQNFTHTCCSSKSFIFTAKKNRKPVTALVNFSGSVRVMRQAALCYQWLPLLSITSCSAFQSLVQALHAHFGLFLIIPHMLYFIKTVIKCSVFCQILCL